MHVNALISELGQLAQNPDEATGNRMAIFEPEIKEIADNVDGLRARRNFIQPFDQLTFPL